MCIAAWALRAHPRWQLVLAANRDELHARPAAPLHRWPDGTGIVAGRDIASGGTWLGISERTGRVALLTNFHTGRPPRADAPSRGALVTDWLTGAWGRPDEHAALNLYNGFSMALFDGERGWVLDNQGAGDGCALAPGYAGLSNSAYSAPWPKVARLVTFVKAAISDDTLDETALFAALAQAGPRADPASAQAPVFIRDGVYGTRCSTVLALAADGSGWIAERRFDATGALSGEERIALRCDTA